MKICRNFEASGVCAHGEKCYNEHSALIGPVIVLKNCYREGQMGNYEGTTEFMRLIHRTVTGSESGTQKKRGRRNVNHNPKKILDMDLSNHPAPHMAGHVYIHFDEGTNIFRVLGELNGLPIELGQDMRMFLEAIPTPLMNLRDGICKKHETTQCNKGVRCDLLHLVKLERTLRRRLQLYSKEDSN